MDVELFKKLEAGEELPETPSVSKIYDERRYQFDVECWSSGKKVSTESWNTFEHAVNCLEYDLEEYDADYNPNEYVEIVLRVKMRK